MSGNDCWNKNVFSRWRKVAVDGDDWQIWYRNELIQIRRYTGTMPCCTRYAISASLKFTRSGRRSHLASVTSRVHRWRCRSVRVWIIGHYESRHCHFSLHPTTRSLFSTSVTDLRLLLIIIIFFFFLLRWPLQRKPNAPSFHIWSGWNLARKFFNQLNVHR